MNSGRDIRYVVLSDLHFGATNSVVTSLTPTPGAAGGYQADPDRPSPMVDAMLRGIASLTADQDTPPTLVLAGDVLDLALSPDEVAATAFSGFVDRAFGSGQPVFGPVVYYLPGNHDHHLWEGTREAGYARRLLALPPDAPIPAPVHTTHISPAQLTPGEGDLMTALIRRRPGCGQVEVRVGYPNLALVTDRSPQVQVLSHGHFTESIYSLMSRLRLILFPDQPDTMESTDVETIEAENFAWIDFFWSTLGRSGEVGIDVSRIYSDLQSPANLDVLATNLAISLGSRRHNPPWLRRVETGALSLILRREVRRTARAERGTPGTALSPNGRQGLRSYLQGPVARQMADQLGAMPPQVGFVFGHTHKPLYETWTLDGYQGSVGVANTGGWVVDTSSPAPFQGGAAVLLDDELNSATLVMYQQQQGGVRPARVLPAPNPLVADLSARVAADDQVWSALGAAAEALVAERWKQQANLEAAPGLTGQPVPPPALSVRKRERTTSASG